MWLLQLLALLPAHPGWLHGRILEERVRGREPRTRVKCTEARCANKADLTCARARQTGVRSAQLFKCTTYHCLIYQCLKIQKNRCLVIIIGLWRYGS